MKWEKKDDYHMESSDKNFSITKAMIGEKAIYNLWKLPYYKSEFIFRSENLEDVKAKAVQFNKDQSTSVDSKITGSSGLPA
jgi:hypothetical protein